MCGCARHHLPAFSRIMPASSAYVRQNARFSASFGVIVNCYGISCRHSASDCGSDVPKWGNDTMPMHKICHPLGVMVIGH